MKPMAHMLCLALKAIWHMLSATNGHCKRIQVFHGNNVPFTDDEKRDRAMKIAWGHIDLMEQAAESGEPKVATEVAPE